MTRRYSAPERWAKSGLVYMCSPFPAFFSPHKIAVRRTTPENRPFCHPSRPYAPPCRAFSFSVSPSKPCKKQPRGAPISAAAGRKGASLARHPASFKAVFSRVCTRARGRVCAGDQLRFLHRFFTMGFIRGFSRGKILSVQSEKFFQSRVKDSFTLREKFFQSQGKVFSVQSEKFFQSEPRKKRADGLNRLLVIGNAAERSGELVIKVQQRKGGHIIPPSRANTSAARL